MRYSTQSGAFVTAANVTAARALAEQYGMGAVIESAPATVARTGSKRKPLSVNAARAMYSAAQDWPRCGQDWPRTAGERAADAVLAANNFDAEE